MKNPAGLLIQVDGVTQTYEMDSALQEQGVIFCDMHTAVAEHGDLVRKHFMTEAVPISEGKFAALHGAFWRGGSFLYVPKGVTISVPLHAVLWSMGGKTFTHTLVVVEPNASATFLDEYGSDKGDTPGIHNGAVELLVRDGGNLLYANLQDFGTNVWQFTHERGRVGTGRKVRLDHQ